VVLFGGMAVGKVPCHRLARHLRKTQSKLVIELVRTQIEYNTNTSTNINRYPCVVLYYVKAVSLTEAGPPSAQKKQM